MELERRHLGPIEVEKSQLGPDEFYKWLKTDTAEQSR